MSGESKTIPEISIESRLLLERLLKASVGDVIAYEELSKIARRDVRVHRGALVTARRRALHDSRRLFGTVQGVGIKLLDDCARVEAGRALLGSARRRARKSVTALASVEDFAAMPADIRLQHNITMSVAGAFVQMTSPQTQKRLARAVEESANPLPLSETLKMFA